MALRVDATQFQSARHFAAWLGPVPRECSTADKQRLSGISRAGDERLRQLVTTAGQGPTGRPVASPWLVNLLSRKPRKLAAVALANKTARTVWATMTRGGVRRRRLTCSSGRQRDSPRGAQEHKPGDSGADHLRCQQFDWCDQTAVIRTFAVAVKPLHSPLGPGEPAAKGVGAAGMIVTTRPSQKFVIALTVVVEAFSSQTS